jgi:hypothetical protein
MKIKFPPKAHYASEEGVIRNAQGTLYPMTPTIVSDQPASRGMTLSMDNNAGEHGEQSVDGPMRLRGGCIPCPVRSIVV